MSDAQDQETTSGKKKRVFRKKKSSRMQVDDLIEKLRSRDRKALAQSITLVESRSPDHRSQAAELIQRVLPFTGESIRIGITGVPGAGKSTWIEALGKKLINKDFAIAILAVDPSSTLSGGSILGDKTRMEQLAHEPDVFIRPSPAAGTLGGVHRMTRETILLCEAAGYDVIIIETVGVGQSESTVRGMVDFFMLLALTGGGDELQGMKKGILELVDAIVINKADGDNVIKAEQAKGDYRQLLHFLQPATEGWKTPSFTSSAITGAGIDDIWKAIVQFKKETQENGMFERRRSSQAIEWMNQMMVDRLMNEFMEKEGRKEQLEQLKQQVRSKRISPADAIEQLFSK
ncbi:methylmalonyl Co-A mutase-associated GTPase MeaB [Jeotgalibacillus sp. ET6]|uniref:methylmalonyl Co-A mutase-associated GTPase MeaB n=1 Tax=Jeotgalibacillus sp. ET6 TaxID=3037260 RepID=UPI0024185C0D|nr:methylmalonyl Co-A mutase-associated GTPase MeaB [Jeotgalibacillus sp. ET6]MDG5470736.1 methylmalonyl Co-A mutase-associated GTPase MeaB [Jeotgalibacillus sp. ET6]